MTRKNAAVAIVGAGNLAKAMARALSGATGFAVTLASRRPSRGAKPIDRAVFSADVVILAVPDREIAAAAATLVPMRDSWRGVVVLHAAGAYGPELLAVLRARGAATGVLHPLAVLGPAGHGTLRGAHARIEGTPKAAAAARRLCAAAGLVPLRGAGFRTAKARTAYHSAASLAANDVVALLAAATGLLVRHGVPERAAIDALTGLAAGAVARVRAAGLAGGLSGPVARNDAATLAAQLRVLAASDAVAGEAHRALSLRLVAVAVASGHLDRKAGAALRALLVRGPGPSGTV
jgi:predicted short-subunit dehydrogenase-like oxidoreductase (DUF2520 family)